MRYTTEDFVDPTVLMRQHELSQIIQETDGLPRDTAEDLARALLRLRSSDGDPARQMALEQIRRYLRSWLADA